jgi:hypothetical protein
VVHPDASRTRAREGEGRGNRLSPTTSAKPDGVGAVSQRLIYGRTIVVIYAHWGDGKRFVAGREKKSQRTRLRERPPRVGQEKSAPLSVPFAQLNRKTLRWEEVSEALMRHEKKSQAGTRPGLWGEIAQLKVRGTRSISPSVLELERQPPCVAHKLQVPKQ